MPVDRLKVLLKQAAAWQVLMAKRKGKKPWTVSSYDEIHRVHGED